MRLLSEHLYLSQRSANKPTMALENQHTIACINFFSRYTKSQHDHFLEKTGSQKLFLSANRFLAIYDNRV